MSKQRKIVAYPAIFDPSDITKDRFTITFPDVPDAISQGDGFTESLAMATEALELSLYDEKDLPTPSRLEDIEKPSDSSMIVYITIDLERASEDVQVPKVRKNTRIDEDLAKEAEKAGLNFSKVLNEALREKLRK